MAGLIIAGVVTLVVIGIWSMCVVAGDADSRMEELMKRKEQNERDERM